ncbi:MAG TPA: LuxR family transcriptional regulator [Micromonosporaceae bacterium]|jgi:DNA-binding NarL/FixJ family response regulator|nr:LuxR family transcriptional regulator [Micromonosporaceae bacterium]
MGEAVAGYLSARPEFVVVGHTVEWPDLMALCALGPPDAVVVDLDPGFVDAVDALRRFAVLFPNVRILVTYERLSPEQFSAAFDAGVTSLVPYSRGLSALLFPLRHVPAQLRHPTGGGRLTDREREVLVLMSCGHNVAEMAALLDISPRTVESHKRRIYAKLDATSQARAVARAAALGVLDRRPPGQPRPVDGAPATHVAVCGPPGLAVDTVMDALKAGSAAFTIERTAGPGAWAGLREWRQHRSVTVLVEPSPLDWRFAGLVDAPLVLVPAPGRDLNATPEAAAARAAAVVAAEHVERDIAAVVAVVASGYVVSDAASRRAPASDGGGGFRGSPWGDGPWSPPELSGRERDILRSAALGETVRQTARSLGIATKTVENLQSRLYRKLGVRNRAAALAVAYGLGLVTVSESTVSGGAVSEGAAPA